MRALKVMLFVTALVTIVSCSKDDDNPAVGDNRILGAWNLSEFSYSGMNSVSNGEETTAVSYTAEAVDLDALVTFVDGSNYTTSGSYTVILTTTVDGETTVQDFPYPDLTGSGTYKVEGDKMITDPNGSQGQIIQASEAVIQELTPNRMVLFIEEHTLTEVEGTEIEIIFEMIQVLTR